MSSRFEKVGTLGHQHSSTHTENRHSGQLGYGPRKAPGAGHLERVAHHLGVGARGRDHDMTPEALPRGGDAEQQYHARRGRAFPELRPADVRQRLVWPGDYFQRLPKGGIRIIGR